MGNYQIIGELHLANCLNHLGEQPTPGFLSRLAIACATKRKVFAYLRETRQKNLFLESQKPDRFSQHMPFAVKSLDCRVAEEVGAEVFFLDANNEDYELREDDNVYQAKREREWKRMITTRDSGLIVVGNWHADRLAKLLERGWIFKKHTAQVIYMPDKTYLTFKKEDCDLLEQIYEIVKDRDRSEVHHLKEFIQNYRNKSSNP